MTDDLQVKHSEIVIRVLMRLPAEADSRPPKDEDDFVRRKLYKKTGGPENGMSLLRQAKFAGIQAVWDYIRASRSLMGYSECIFEKVLAKRLRFKVTGVNGCHISLRCPECDMSDLPTYCKPKSAPDYSYCPFFDVDTFDLEPEFELIAAPALRALSPKSG